MKYKAYAIFQLVILVLYLLRPVMPYIEYALNKDFIAKNFCVNKEKPKSCCHGKCYLEKQVKKSSETNDDKEKNSNKKIQNEEVNEFLNSPINLPKAIVGKSVFKIPSEEKTAPPFLHTLFIPPQQRIFI